MTDMSSDTRRGSFVSTSFLVVLLFTSYIQLSGRAAGGQAAESVTAIVGATVIDGNGGPPLADTTVVVRGKRIAAIGPRASVTVPAGATVIDGAAKYVTPGFLDTNVHTSLYGGGIETLARY